MMWLVKDRNILDYFISMTCLIFFKKKMFTLLIISRKFMSIIRKEIDDIN